MHQLETTIPNTMGYMVYMLQESAKPKRKLSDTVTAGIIIKTISDYFHVDAHRIFTKSRLRDIVICRQMAMRLIKSHTQMTLKQIGEYFGGFDHTTVIHSAQTVDNLCDTDEEYRNEFKSVSKEVDLAITKLRSKKENTAA